MLGLARTAQISGWQTYGFTNPLTTWVGDGAGELSTAEFQFGTASMYTNSNQSTQSGFEVASSDTISDRTFLDFNTGDFTVSMWIRQTSSTPTNRHQDIMANNRTGGFGMRFGQSFGSGSNNGLNIFARAQADLDYCAFAWSVNTWHWIVVQRSGTTITFWVDGTQQTTSGSGGGSRNFADANNTQITYGNAQGTDGSQFVYFDELNVTVGTALYPASGSISVPTAPFVVEQFTTQLVHWDGANGATTCDNDQG
jgi:hypothetical protein